MLTSSRLANRQSLKLSHNAMQCRGTFLGAPWGPFHDVRKVWDEFFGRKDYRAHSMGIASKTLTPCLCMMHTALPSFAQGADTCFSGHCCRQHLLALSAACSGIQQPLLCLIVTPQKGFFLITGCNSILTAWHCKQL